MSMKERILEKALELFSEHGFNSVSTKLLAKEVGCNEVTIFRLFKSKYGILEQITKNFLEMATIIENLKKVLNGNLEDDIESVIRVYDKFLRGNELIFRIQLKFSHSEIKKYTRSIEYKDFVVEHFREIFIKDNLNLPVEEFVIQILSSVIGNFLFYIQTENGFTKIEWDDLLESNIRIYKYFLRK